MDQYRFLSLLGADSNRALKLATRNDHIGVVKLLLSSPLVDPWCVSTPLCHHSQLNSALNMFCVASAWQRKNYEMFFLLLTHPRGLKTYPHSILLLSMANQGNQFIFAIRSNNFQIRKTGSCLKLQNKLSDSFF